MRGIGEPVIITGAPVQGSWTKNFSHCGRAVQVVTGCFRESFPHRALLSKLPEHLKVAAIGRGGVVKRFQYPFLFPATRSGLNSAPAQDSGEGYLDHTTPAFGGNNITWQINGRAIAPPGQEGWPRHQEKYREASFDGADGVVVQDRQNSFEPEQPPRLRREGRFAPFFDAAATPPGQEGRVVRPLDWPSIC